MLKTPNNENGVDKKIFDDMIAGLVKDRADFLTGFGKNFFGVNMINKPISQATLDFSHSLVMRGAPVATQKCV